MSGYQKLLDRQKQKRQRALQKTARGRRTLEREEVANAASSTPRNHTALIEQLVSENFEKHRGKKTGV